MKREEIERRFLLYPCDIKSFLQKNGFRYKLFKIKQFYLPSSPESSSSEVIRYRKENGKYIKTVKRGEGLKREEIEKEVDKKEFKAFLKKRDGKVIKKRRYKVCIDGKVYEFDEFRGFLKGLLILEVEFESESEASHFKVAKPFLCLIAKEITGYREFSNKALSLSQTIPSIKCDIKDIFENVNSRKDFYKASLRFDFHPFYCVKDLLKLSLYFLSNSVKVNRKAILKGDKDIERLHQFRVALRKIRAVFSLLDTLFVNDFIKDLKKDLSFVMKKTNDKRDLDVYIEMMGEYEKILPQDLKGAMEPFKKCLISVEKEESKKLIDFLKSQKVENVLKTLEKLSFDDKYFTKTSLSPAVILAKKLLKKQYKEVVKEGEKLSFSSSAKEFHKIRIEFKKLRYLSEIFSSVLDKNSYKKWQKILKDIQTVLGEHQDLTIQREHLKIFSSIKEVQDKKVLKAIRYFRKYMKDKIFEKRELFLEKFDSFKEEEEILLKSISRC